MEKIKSKIKELRISKNLTQQQLADELHVTKQAISKWEKGKSVPDITSVELLSSFFGVSADYLINDGIVATKHETTVVSSKRINKLSIVLISALALMFVAVVALSITLGVILNKNRPDMVDVNGFEITYLADETLDIYQTDKVITLNFHIYNSTDFAKTCMTENFAVDNGELSLYIDPNGYRITAHEELKLKIVLIVRDPNKRLGNLDKHSVTVKYAGQAIATIKW